MLNTILILLNAVLVIAMTILTAIDKENRNYKDILILILFILLLIENSKILLIP